MTFLMYFTSFGSLLVFFASAIAVTLWVLTRFILAWGRFLRALIFPSNIPKRRENVSIGLHQHHLKRAGQ